MCSALLLPNEESVSGNEENLVNSVNLGNLVDDKSNQPNLFRKISNLIQESFHIRLKYLFSNELKINVWTEHINLRVLSFVLYNYFPSSLHQGNPPKTEENLWEQVL